ncbi:integrase [Janthinobacterium fluminis]|uniref:Integrase n=1 Tax=Janthinobacterium fluminis TaxID=2987524 RepID=A0ABT5K600_9BURK|nr:integrase [Janthinobacterium fluminis]MDC8759850.1 integrase [Janthinobacterium fluminis]
MMKLDEETSGITRADLRRFEAVATIDDLDGFRDVLAEFIRRHGERHGMAQTPAGGGEVLATLQTKAAALSRATPWQMDQGDIQRGRTLMLKQFAAPGNLSVAHFATLAGKSRAQIYQDIKARRYLALSVGGRGLRLPDFQLDPSVRRIVLALLDSAPDVEPWTIYALMSDANDALGGNSPAQTRNKHDADHVIAILLAQLGWHGPA